MNSEVALDQGSGRRRDRTVGRLLGDTALDVVWFTCLLPACFVVSALPSRMREALTKPVSMVHHKVIRAWMTASAGKAATRKVDWTAYERLCRSFARMWSDTLFVVGSSAGRSTRQFGSPDLAELRRVFKVGHSDQGGVLGITHQGSFFAGGAVLAACGVPVSVVTKTQNRIMERILVRLTHRFGLEAIRVDPSSTLSVADAMVDAARRGRVVVVATDIYRGRRGGRGRAEVTLLGGKTEVGVGAALTALRSGKPVVVGGMLHSGRRRDFEFTAPLLPKSVPVPNPSEAAVAEATQCIVDAAEQLIRERPEQWYIAREHPGCRVDNPALGTDRPERSEALGRWTAPVAGKAADRASSPVALDR